MKRKITPTKLTPAEDGILAAREDARKARQARKPQYCLEIAKVAKKVSEAIKILSAIETQAREARDWGMVGSVADYKKDLSEILSSDHGEAGLEAFATALEEQEKE